MLHLVNLSVLHTVCLMLVLWWHCGVVVPVTMSVLPELLCHHWLWHHWLVHSWCGGQSLDHSPCECSFAASTDVYICKCTFSVPTDIRVVWSYFLTEYSWYIKPLCDVDGLKNLNTKVVLCTKFFVYTFWLGLLYPVCCYLELTHAFSVRYSTFHKFFTLLILSDLKSISVLRIIVE